MDEFFKLIFTFFGVGAENEHFVSNYDTYLTTIFPTGFITVLSASFLFLIIYYIVLGRLTTFLHQWWGFVITIIVTSGFVYLICTSNAKEATTLYEFDPEGFINIYGISAAIDTLIISFGLSFFFKLFSIHSRYSPF